MEHHSQFIARALAAGRLQLHAQAQRVLFHDPCCLARHNDETAAPRHVLAAVCSDPPLEFELNAAKAMCCGAGGGRMWLEEKIGQRINVLRVEQALARRPEVIATACPYCALMIDDGLKALNRDGDVKNLDIAELVAAALPGAAAMAPPAAGHGAPRAASSSEAAHA